jgi:hypothetical protein
VIFVRDIEKISKLCCHRMSSFMPAASAGTLDSTNTSQLLMASRPLSTLPLPEHIQSKLLKAGYTTVGDLRGASADGLFAGPTAHFVVLLLQETQTTEIPE